jgi:hypothetical protein
MWTILEASNDKTAHLPQFDEPLVLGAPPPAQGSWLATVGWLLLMTVLSAGFVAQLVIFNKDMVLRDSRVRDLLANLCARVACELPVVRAPDQLRSTFIEVSPHPDYESMLLVRFGIFNAALFAQPHPSVDLSFSNTQQQAVAGRRFYPGHYLDASLLSRLTIPAGSEIQGTLEILDPGPEAVNYTIEFVYEHN